MRYDRIWDDGRRCLLGTRGAEHRRVVGSRVRPICRRTTESSISSAAATNTAVIQCCALQQKYTHGGSANGMPKKRLTSPSTVPTNAPLSRRTVGCVAAAVSLAGILRPSTPRNASMTRQSAVSSAVADSCMGDRYERRGGSQHEADDP